MQYNLNPIARAIGKKPEAFTKADITKYILDNDIHELNFRYTAADGHLKVLNFVIQDADYLDEVLFGGTCGRLQPLPWSDGSWLL